jgi:hypothetical protein
VCGSLCTRQRCTFAARTSNTRRAARHSVTSQRAAPNTPITSISARGYTPRRGRLKRCASVTCSSVGAALRGQPPAIPLTCALQSMELVKQPRVISYTDTCAA